MVSLKASSSWLNMVFGELIDVVLIYFLTLARTI